MSAAGFPSWVLLEPIVLRRDDDESFPDVTKAPIRATGTTSSSARFRIAFSLAEPPQISRLYAQLPVPEFPDGREADPLCIVATHRHLVLIRVGTWTLPEKFTLQNFFIFRADENPSSLQVLPPCTEPISNYAPTPDSDRVPYRRRLPNPRLLDIQSMGLWCRGKEFVVAELRLFQPINRPKIFADICLLRSDGDHLGRTWKTVRVKILSASHTSDDNLWQICCWSTDAVIPFGKWLCWIDYQRGILFCDMSKLPNPPTVSFIWFPVGKLPPTATRTVARSFFYRGVSVVDHDRTLKFVNITRDDGIPFGPLKPGGSFTITCHTLTLESGRPNDWKEDYKLTSRELWDANTADLLPRDILIFPRVDINRPHVAHFLFIEFGCTLKKMSVVTIDMSTKIVESCSLCINGEEGLKTDDVDLIVHKSLSPEPFLPCEFSRFLNLSRNSKDMAKSSLPTSS